jgi:hypothetical protein
MERQQSFFSRSHLKCFLCFYFGIVPVLFAKKGFLCGVFESWKIKKAWWCTQLFAVFFIGF